MGAVWCNRQMLATTLRHHSTFLLVGLLTLAGAFVRLYGLGEWDYYHDEIWHVYVARQPTLADVFYVNLAEDGHPILGYFLWHWLLNIWNDPWMARLPSLVAGLLSIPAGYLLGRELFKSAHAGLFFAFFFAFSYLMIEQSNVVRGYSLMLFFSVLSLWSVYRYQAKPHLGYILLYFFATSLSLLSEFATAPLVAFTALHLLHTIYRLPAGKALPFCLWVVMHLFWLLYLLQFMVLLKTIGGIDFSQSHIFFNRDVQPFLKTFAGVITFFLEYINVAGFTWAIGLVTQSELLVVPPLLFLLMISLVGCVALTRARAWDLLGLVAVLVAIVIAFYWLRLVPLASPRRNMVLYIAFIILFYAGIRHCVVHLLKGRRVSFTVEAGLYILLTGAIMGGYGLYGKEWRVWRQVEFQQTRERGDDIMQFLRDNVGNRDIVVTDMGSAYHLWMRTERPALKLLSKHIATLVTPEFKVFASPSDLRMKAFISDPHEMQRMFREMDRLGLLKDVRNVWILGMQHTNVKSILIEPTFRFYVNAIIPYEAQQDHLPEIKRMIDMQEKLADDLLNHLSLRKQIYFVLDCKNPPEIVVGKEHPCIMSSAIVGFPLSVIKDKIINAADYPDSEKLLKAMLKKVQKPAEVSQH